MQKENLNRKNKGITLIALIITIIVMLILVALTISVSLNGGLFTIANEATTQMDIAQEKEQLLTAAMGALGEDGKVDFDKLDNNLPEGFQKVGEGTYESSTGNTFTVNENGNITLEDDSIGEEAGTPATITLSETEINKEITSGTPETVELTATLNNASGDLTWESSDSTVVEISESGTTRTITLKKSGTAIITVSYGTATATCTVNITEKEAVLQIGDKVKYNEGTGYTSTIDSNFAMEDLEWRILDIEDDGTIELVSTRATTSTLTLSGKEGWLHAEEYLDTLCDDLYGNGSGSSGARCLKSEDIVKLTNNRFVSDNNWCKYRYDTGNYHYYSYSSDYNPQTGEGTWSDESRSSTRGGVVESVEDGITLGSGNPSIEIKEKGQFSGRFDLLGLS